MAAVSRSALILAGALAFLPAACASPPAKEPNLSHPLDEGHAVPLIAQTLQKEGDVPTEGRDIVLPSGRSLHVDVFAQGRRYGIAYLTAADTAKLDAKFDIPPRSGNDLPVVQGSGKDTGSFVLLLFDADYSYDDFIGEKHEHTAIAAEKKLGRDVRDFITAARRQP
jgi:hypothetical protein